MLLCVTNSQVCVRRHDKSQFDPKHVQATLQGDGRAIYGDMLHMDANWIWNANQGEISHWHP